MATTPFVVEKLIAIVSSSQGDPAASRAPVHASTTSSPRWYTAAAAPPPRLCAATFRNACVTPPKSGCTKPEITPAYLALERR